MDHRKLKWTFHSPLNKKMGEMDQLLQEFDDNFKIADNPPKGKYIFDRTIAKGQQICLSNQDLLPQCNFKCFSFCFDVPY